ncbi:vanadium-dependent haloperoxidase [Flagellimonas algicola]|uniref:Vanadium-dependent haloperoxidase n=1 Tax=Flagellimonas algicola TaxID=2583815 RepID=A0ABY2WN68_9FLAO|nr:vanadium-dependent haloperoxidase [Allomuricauda algicola]TMU56333.1 vanadium-dependent haloperoxidase [Allomuricauda algicola]
MKKVISKSYWIVAVAVFINACSERKEYTEQDVVLEWAKMATYITQFTPANSPTFASRGFGYIGLTMYESVVPGFESNNSMQGQLNGLDQLPQPEKDKTYNWELSLNAGQAQILRQIYLQTSDENKARIDSLEQEIYRSYSDKINDLEIVERSVSYGKEVANAIFEWSKSDGGHRGYLYNFDKEMIHPERPGSWKPPLFAQSFSHYPLHPHWGENRRFLKENAALEVPYMIPYDTIPGSPYYEEYMEVYKKDLALTQEEKEAAIWWGDDPDVSFTPPGHSYYYVTLAVEKKLPSMIEAAEAYAKTSIAVADAFINCWEWKYHFFSERPNTFIPKFIDQEWESFWPDPPFPAFPSGHAINAGAMATVLEHEFGKEVQITDRAHEGRERDEVRDTDFVVRSFNSFWEAAQETADSRFYGGIHTPQDNRVGLDEGMKIAQNVINLNWRKSD